MLSSIVFFFPRIARSLRILKRLSVNRCRCRSFTRHTSSAHDGDRVSHNQDGLDNSWGCGRAHNVVAVWIFCDLTGPADTNFSHFTMICAWNIWNKKWSVYNKANRPFVLYIKKTDNQCFGLDSYLIRSEVCIWKVLLHMKNPRDSIDMTGNERWIVCSLDLCESRLPLYYCSTQSPPLNCVNRFPAGFLSASRKNM